MNLSSRTGSARRCRSKSEVVQINARANSAELPEYDSDAKIKLARAAGGILARTRPNHGPNPRRIRRGGPATLAGLLRWPSRAANSTSQLRLVIVASKQRTV